jgi:hypothetical protein
MRFAATCFLLKDVRALDVSATCTAPPPTSAPPAAHAQSFAIAIRTDMMSHPLHHGLPRAACEPQQQLLAAIL